MLHFQKYKKSEEVLKSAMDIEIKKDDWHIFFKEFREKNHLRPAKLEVFNDAGTQTEVDVMPFSGIDLEIKGEDSPIVNLSFGDERADGRHISHNINSVDQILLNADEYGNDQALEIETKDNTRTLLIFTKLTEIGTD